MRSKSPLARVKSFVSDLLLWSFFIVSLAAAMGATGAFLDGTEKTVATFAGIAVSLVTGSKITKKPKIKEFLGSRPVLWFLFLFNGGVAAFAYLTMDGAKGIATAVGMGLVSLGALGGLISNYRHAGKATAEAAPVASLDQPVYDAQYEGPVYGAPQYGDQPTYGTPYRQQPDHGQNRPADDSYGA